MCFIGKFGENLRADNQRACKNTSKCVVDSVTTCLSRVIVCLSCVAMRFMKFLDLNYFHQNIIFTFKKILSNKNYIYGDIIFNDATNIFKKLKSV